MICVVDDEVSLINKAHYDSHGILFSQFKKIVYMHNMCWSRLVNMFYKY